MMLRRWGLWPVASLLVACGGGVTSGGNAGAPTATLTAPANFAANLTGLLPISATAGDDHAVTLVDFEVDGVAVGSDSSVPYEANIATSNYAAGQHIVRARARDADGNFSAWSAATVQFGGSAGVPAGFTKNESWVTSLTDATAFAQAPDGRIFVCEQAGDLRVIDANGALQLTPVISLSPIDASGGERGLLGVALHPNFVQNGWIYLYYTSTQNSTHNRIGRFTVIGNTAQASSELIIADLPTLSASKHNGGALHFGADGKLYVGVGDNGDGAKAQIKTDPFGKILRFNDDGSVPSDNPFIASGQTQLANAVWAYGLRNPFTFAVQPGTGRIHINDVGESTWEEVDVGAAGANYGWPASEGPDGVGSGVTAPLFAYRHTATPLPGSGPGGFFTGAVISGGAFYPLGGSFPAAYQGNYFFADFASGFVARMDQANANAVYAFANIASDNPVDMLVGVNGALYVLGRTSVTRISAP